MAKVILNRQTFKIGEYLNANTCSERATRPSAPI